MILNLSLLLSCVLISYSLQYDVLSLNPASTVFDDIKSIKHNFAQRQIIIDFHPYRRCIRPTLMVRMSGPSVYLLEEASYSFSNPRVKVTQYTDLLPNRTDSHRFSYPSVVDSGKYHIETLILVCTSVNPENYAGVCLEDVQKGRNILNMPYNFSTRGITVHKPRWVHQNATSPSYVSSLLPTRYQRHDCPDVLFCTHTDASLHNQYVWTDGPDWRVPLHQVTQRLTSSTVRAHTNYTGLIYLYSY